VVCYPGYSAAEFHDSLREPLPSLLRRCVHARSQFGPQIFELGCHALADRPMNREFARGICHCAPASSAMLLPTECGTWCSVQINHPRILWIRTAPACMNTWLFPVRIPTAPACLNTWLCPI